MTDRTVDVSLLVPQHLMALKGANKIRPARADLKHRIRKLPRSDSWGLLADVILDVPACIANVLVFELLQWPRNLGLQYADRFMHAARVGLSRTVGQLTVRQREALVECLRGSVADVLLDAEIVDWAVRVNGRASRAGGARS